MTFALRDYQAEMIAKARLKLRQHNAVLMQAPTGAGKTALATSMLGSASSRGNRSAFIVHRQELVDQTIATFEKVGVPYGVIAAGYDTDLEQPVQICAIDTLRNRLSMAGKFRLVVWDECHHIAAASWSCVREHYTGAKHVGLSATPCRLDGRGLDQHFEAMVLGPTVAWLIEQGFLCRYRAFGPPQRIDTKGIRKAMGDFARGALSDAVDKPAIIGNAVDHYLRLARGKRAISFCVSVKHSENTAAAFRAAGIPAAHLDGTTDKKIRRDAIEAFRRGDLLMLSNVDLFGEGFDLPAIECVIDMAPTQSLGRVMQRWGRALRPQDGKDAAILLDHANNMERHGYPDDERAWALTGVVKSGDGGDTFPVRQCPMCFAAHRPTPTCPECGFIYPAQEREVEQVEGDLVEIDVRKKRQSRAFEQSQAESLDELIALGKKRGYRYAEQWAAKIFTSRARQKAKKVYA